MEMYFDMSEYNKSKLETNEMFSISLYFCLYKKSSGGRLEGYKPFERGGQAYVNYM